VAVTQGSRNVQIASGDASILDAVVGQHHAEVRAMMEEANRATDTPGVYAHLNRSIANRLGGLLAVEAEVLDAPIERHAGAEAVSRLHRQRDCLTEHLAALGGRLNDRVPGELRATFEEHAAAVREAVSSIAAADGVAARAVSFRYMERASG
jgi:hypothetical protein